MTSKLTASEEEVRDALIGVLQGNVAFWQSTLLVEWASVNLTAREDAPRDAWEIIEDNLTSTELTDPALLAAGWLLALRGDKAEDVARDTKQAVEKVIPAKKNQAEPRRFVSTRRLVAAACLLHDEEWVRGKDRNPATVFQPGRGFTPGEKLVATRLMLAAEDWFEESVRAPQSVEPQSAAGLALSTVAAQEADGGSPDQTVPKAEVTKPSAADRDEVLAREGAASSDTSISTELAPEVAGLGETDAPVLVKSARSRLSRRRAIIVAFAVVAVGVSAAAAVALNPPQAASPPVQDGATNRPTPYPSADATIPVAESTSSDYTRVGWGPKRVMFTLDSGGSPYPSFNSLLDNPNIGDERNFVGLRKKTDADIPNVWSDDVWGKPGDSFVMRVYVNNSGGDDVTSEVREALVDARVRIGVQQGDDEASVFGVLTAANAKTVWDGARIHFEPGTQAVLDEGSVRFENNGLGPEGVGLTDDVFKESGATLGYTKLDGELKPGFQYVGYVTAVLTLVESSSGR